MTIAFYFKLHSMKDMSSVKSSWGLKLGDFDEQVDLYWVTLCAF